MLTLQGTKIHETNNFYLSANSIKQLFVYFAGIAENLQTKFELQEVIIRTRLNRCALTVFSPFYTAG
jgi:hypothetical protein